MRLGPHSLFLLRFSCRLRTLLLRYRAANTLKLINPQANQSTGVRTISQTRGQTIRRRAAVRDVRERDHKQLSPLAHLPQSGDIRCGSGLICHEGPPRSPRTSSPGGARAAALGYKGNREHRSGSEGNSCNGHHVELPPIRRVLGCSRRSGRTTAHRAPWEYPARSAPPQSAAACLHRPSVPLG